MNMDQNKLTNKTEIKIMPSTIIQGILVVQLVALVASTIMDISQKGSIDMRAFKTIGATIIIINFLLLKASK